MTRRDRRPTSNRGVNITRRLRKTELHQLETASHISAEGTIPVWRRLRLSHKCGTIFLRITNGMTGRPSPVAQRLPADRSESHLPPEDFSTVIEGTSQHTSAIYSFRICATPVAGGGGGGQKHSPLGSAYPIRIGACKARAHRTGPASTTPMPALPNNRAGWCFSRQRLTAPIRNETPRFPRLTGTKTPDFRAHPKRITKNPHLKRDLKTIGNSPPNQCDDRHPLREISAAGHLDPSASRAVSEMRPDPLTHAHELDILHDINRLQATSYPGSEPIVQISCLPRRTSLVNKQ